MRTQNPKPTKAGYIRLKRNGRMVMEHRLVWEEENGPIPPGFELHHVDHDKTNNDISNLQLVDRLTHRRIEEGWVQAAASWMKRCRACDEYKIVGPDNWYMRKKDYPSDLCRPCQIVANVNHRRQKP